MTAGAKSAGQKFSGRRLRRGRGRSLWRHWRMSLRLGRFDSARSGTTRSAAGKRKQSDVAGALDSDAEPALVTRADTGHAARKNFAALLHELRKNVGALVVDQIDLLDTELADFFLAEELAFATARPAGAAAGAAGSTRTAFTTSASAAGSAFAAATAVPTVSATSTTRAAFAAWRWG